MLLYLKKRPVPWWKKSGWWQLIVSVIVLLLPAMAYLLKVVWSSPLAPVPIHTVPAEWYRDQVRELDSTKAEYYDLRLEYEKLLDSIEYLNRIPLELDIFDLVQPPASFRLIADSLESLIQAGLVVRPEMLLRIGNASFAIGDYERAERFYWRVPVNAQYSGLNTPFEIAVRNCGVVSGMFGNDEGRKHLLDNVNLYSRMRQLAQGTP